MIAADAGLAVELPVLPVLFETPLAVTLKVYDVPVVSPLYTQEFVPYVIRVVQVPVRPDGVDVIRYDAMPAPMGGGVQDTVTEFGFTL